MGADFMVSPSVPAAADPSVIDLSHLRSMTMSDAALEREVLELFVAQSREITAALAAWPDNAAALAHTLKGSARAIGAFRVADAAAAIEDALRSEDAGSQVANADALARLNREIALTCSAIANILRGS
jgi:HPt (histidine-containing phosphotransfer) domain-containing protein